MAATMTSMGSGTTTNPTLLLQDSSATTRLSFLDNGTLTHTPAVAAGTATVHALTAGITAASGTGQAYTNLSINSTYNLTGTFAGTIIGIDYSPMLTSMTGVTHIAFRATSGSVLVGGTALTNSSAIVDLQSSSQVLLLTRVVTEGNITAPVNGMIYYNSTSDMFRVYQGGAWASLLTGSAGYWALSGTSTLTGVATIQSNAANQHIFNGTWTSAAATDFAMKFNHTITAASGLGATGYQFAPAMTASGTSSAQIAVQISPTFSGGTTPSNIALQVRVDQNAQTLVNVVNATSGTAATVNFAVSNGTNALSLLAFSTAFSTTGMNIANTNCIQSNGKPLNIGTASSGGALGLWVNNTQAASITTGQQFLIGYTSPVTGELAGIRKDQNSSTYLYITNGTSGTTASAQLFISPGASTSIGVQLITPSASFSTTNGSLIANNAILRSTTSGGMHLAGLSIGLWTGTNTTNVKVVNIDTAGNVTITQQAQSSGWGKAILFTPGAHTGLTASTEFIDYDFATRSVQWTANVTPVPTQRFSYFRGQTLTGTAATAFFSDVYTVFIDPTTAGTNATINRNWALGCNGNLVVAGKSIFGMTGAMPAALIDIAPGTATVPQLRLISGGTLLSTPINGSIECPDSFYITKGPFSSTQRLGLGGKALDHFADAGSPASSTETDLYTDSLNAGFIINNGDTLKAKYGLQVVSTGGATKRIRAYFAGFVIYDSTAIAFSSTTYVALDVTIIVDSSTSVRCLVEESMSSGNVNPTITKITGLTLSGFNIIKITGQSGSGAAANDIVAILGIIEQLPAAA
jgi:hypothetical protein